VTPRILPLGFFPGKLTLVTRGGRKEGPFFLPPFPCRLMKEEGNRCFLSPPFFLSPSSILPSEKGRMGDSLSPFLSFFPSLSEQFPSLLLWRGGDVRGVRSVMLAVSLFFFPFPPLTPFFLSTCFSIQGGVATMGDSLFSLFFFF